MKLQIEKWERWFLYATTVMLVAFLVAIFASIGEAGIHLPTDEDQIDPNLLEFAAFEGNPAPFNDLGVRPYEGPDEDIDLEVVLLAQAWAFSDGSGAPVPNVQLPAGARVEFVITSVDTVHGLMIAEVAVNAMVIPGQITRVVAEFDEPGTYNIICHEFCGLLHHNMYATVEVTG
jgi:cytochrome c oxidase subunit 2